MLKHNTNNVSFQGFSDLCSSHLQASAQFCNYSECTGLDTTCKQLSQTTAWNPNSVTTCTLSSRPHHGFQSCTHTCTVNFQVHAPFRARNVRRLFTHAHTSSGFKFKLRQLTVEYTNTYSMASCEPRRSSAYSEDVRWRIVWQSQALSLSHTEIATNLNINISTVKRVLQIFTTTGDVCKKTYPSERAYRKINEPVQHYILYLILARPGIYLREIVSELSTVLGLDITESAVCKFLKKNWIYTPQASYICPPKG